MPSRVLLAVTLTGVLAAVAPAAGRAPSRSCPSARTVTRTAALVVYERDEPATRDVPAGTLLLACERATGRRTELARDGGDGIKRSTTFSTVRAAGTHVVVIETSFDGNGSAFQYVDHVDVARRRFTSAGLLDRCDGLQGEPVRSLRVSAGGRVAWIQRLQCAGSMPVGVYGWSGSRLLFLDPGPGFRDLRLTASGAMWSSRTGPHHAILDPVRGPFAGTVLTVPPA